MVMYYNKTGIQPVSSLKFDCCDCQWPKASGGENIYWGIGDPPPPLQLFVDLNFDPEVLLGEDLMINCAVTSKRRATCPALT